MNVDSLLDFFENIQLDENDSRIASEEEIDKYSKQLGSILQYVEQMNEVDTTGIEPMPHAIPVYNVMREDVVKYEQTKDEMLANAPFEEDGFFRVPKIN